jgi:hypothetical protein
VRVCVICERTEGLTRDVSASPCPSVNSKSRSNVVLINPITRP